VLGAIAGLLQTKIGRGGPNARFKAGLMLDGSLSASAIFFVLPEADELLKTVTRKDIRDDSIVVKGAPRVNITPIIKRKNSVLRTKFDDN